jgi:hypothetical protein
VYLKSTIKNSNGLLFVNVKISLGLFCPERGVRWEPLVFVMIIGAISVAET